MKDNTTAKIILLMLKELSKLEIENMNLKIYQIYYKPEQLSTLDSNAIPLDNTENLNPGLREYPIFKKGMDQAIKDGATHFGFLSPKFEDKARCSVKKFQDFCEGAFNAGADVVFLNPKFVLEAVSTNVFTQGEVWHPGICDLTNTILFRMYKTSNANKLDVRNFLMNKHVYAFCNYFVGSVKFWKGYTHFVDHFLAEVDKDEKIRSLMYEVSAGYNFDKAIPFYSFVVERLFSAYLFLYSTTLKISSMPVELEMVKHKMDARTHSEVIALSYLKSKLDGRDEMMFMAWQNLGNLWLKTNNMLLSME
jgi:hypothetical protein